MAVLVTSREHDVPRFAIDCFTIQGFWFLGFYEAIDD